MSSSQGEDDALHGARLPGKWPGRLHHYSSGKEVWPKHLSVSSFDLVEISCAPRCWLFVMAGWRAGGAVGVVEGAAWLIGGGA